MHRLLPLLALLLAGSAHAAGADYVGLVEELHAIHPDAARHLSAGLDAWSEDPARAEGLLSEAMTKAPGFAPLARVGCELALENGRRSRALHWCRQANIKGESPETMRTLALALATPVRGSEPTLDELAEAAELAVRSALLAPEDAVAAQSLCEVALYADDGPRLQTCVTQLHHLDPEGMPTRYYEAHLLAARGRLWAARRTLDAAQEAGLAPALYDDARRTFLARRAEGLAHAEAMGILAVGWLALVLAVVGLARAGRRAVARDAESMIERPLDKTDAWPASVQRHRDVLRLLAAVGGLSVLIALVIVVVAGLGVVRQLVSQPLPAPEAAAVVGCVVVLLYGLFLQLALPQARTPAVDRGFPVDLAAYPALSSVLERARAAADAAPLDRVLLVPDCTLAVRLDAGGLEQLVGSPERHLWIGVALLDRVAPAALAALLTRELARDAHEDAPARLRRLLPDGLEARRGLSTAATWNPWWLGAGLATRGWLSSTDAYARFADGRLDRLVARSSSPGALAEGLESIVRAEWAWAARLEGSTEALLDAEGGLRNLYAAPRSRATAPAPSLALAARIAALRAHEDSETTAPSQGSSSWAILPGREGIEQEMTRLQRRLLRQAAGDDHPPA